MGPGTGGCGVGGVGGAGGTGGLGWGGGGVGGVGGVGFLWWVSSGCRVLSGSMILSFEEADGGFRFCRIHGGTPAGRKRQRQLTGFNGDWGGNPATGVAEPHLCAVRQRKDGAPGNEPASLSRTQSFPSESRSTVLPQAGASKLRWPISRVPCGLPGRIAMKLKHSRIFVWCYGNDNQVLSFCIFHIIDK